MTYMSRSMSRRLRQGRHPSNRHKADAERTKWTGDQESARTAGTAGISCFRIFFKHSGRLVCWENSQWFSSFSHLIPCIILIPFLGRKCKPRTSAFFPKQRKLHSSTWRNDVTIRKLIALFPSYWLWDFALQFLSQHVACLNLVHLLEHSKRQNWGQEKKRIRAANMPRLITKFEQCGVWTSGSRVYFRRMFCRQSRN